MTTEELSSPNKSSMEQNENGLNTSDEADSTTKNNGDESVAEENEVNTSQNTSTSSTPGRSKREKKKVDRLSMEVSKKEQPEKAEGMGTPLGDIAFIKDSLQKHKGEDLKLLHRLAFGKPGAALTVRRNLYTFNGYSFTKNDDAYEKKRNIINKAHSTDLKKVLALLGLERSGLKSELVERVLEFLLDPHDSGKTVPKKKKRRSSTAKKGKGKKTPKRSTKKATKKAEESDDEEEESENESSEEEEETPKSPVKEESKETDESDQDSDNDDEEEEKPKKKPAKKPQPKAKKAPPPKKAPQPKKRPRTPSTTDSDSDADVPLKKMVKKEPTNEEIEEYIKKLLETADLEEVTMKKLCQQVYDHYPNNDLTEKKDFIKSTVKSILAA